MLQAKEDTGAGCRAKVGAMERIYREGRCGCCGRRVTVDCENSGHTRDGLWCGPVETEHPFGVSDEPTGNRWMVPRDTGLTKAAAR